MMRLTIDSASGLVTSDVAQKPIGLGTFINRVQGKYLNLGLLPPVVRLITPLVDNYFYVLVECRPRMQTIMFMDKTYLIPLPWHTVCMHVYYEPSNDQIMVVHLWLWFQEREAMSEFDFSLDFYRMPWLPNLTPHGGVCLTENFQSHPSFLFIDAWHEANAMLWTTPFNYDFATGINAYAPIVANGEEFNYVDRWDCLLTELSELTLEQACAKELISIDEREKEYIDIPFLKNLPSINPVLTLMDMFKAFK